MLDYEFSAESLYADGTGMSSVKPVATYYAMSSEANDGDLDSTFNDVQSAENALQFLDLYSAIENKNASDKIRMLRKIKANYGGNSSQLTNSVENYCNELSMEAEAAAAAAGGDASADPKSEASGKGGKEKKNFFVVMFKAIGNFFVMIWKFFVNIWNAIVNFVKNLFTKKKKKEEAGDAEAVPPVAKAKAVAGPSIQIDFAKSNLGSGKITSFVQEYEQLGRDIVAVFNNIEQEVFNGQQGDKRTLDSVNLGKNSISHLERFRVTVDGMLRVPGIDLPRPNPDAKTKGVSYYTGAIKQQEAFLKKLSGTLKNGDQMLVKDSPSSKMLGYFFNIKFTDKINAKIDPTPFGKSFVDLSKKVEGPISKTHKTCEETNKKLLARLNAAPSDGGFLTKINDSLISTYGSILKTMGTVEQFIMKLFKATLDALRSSAANVTIKGDNDALDGMRKDSEKDFKAQYRDADKAKLKNTSRIASAQKRANADLNAFGKDINSKKNFNKVKSGVGF